MRITQETITEREFEGNSATTLCIAPECKRVQYKAFANCKNLVSVVIEQSSEPIAIETSAFDGCNSIVIFDTNRPVRFSKDLNLRRMKYGRKKTLTQT